MKFRTEIETTPFPSGARIGYADRILSLGSCFAEEMAARLRRMKFACTVNPSGVLFNPASVAEALDTFAAGTPVKAGELQDHEGLWFHFEFHGSFSSIDPEQALARMNAARRAGAEALRNCNRIILTFGTAWVYERGGQIVANCHRRPAAEFVRRRLSVAEIVDRYDALFTGALADKQVILTVSPVRHLGDGLAGNCLSKAVLRLATDALTERHAHVSYFPAYEILTDDLRDYRFYAGDLVHPTPQAVEYVWEKFAQAVLDDHARQVAPAVARIADAAAHRPQNPRSEAFRAFCLRQLAAMAALPNIDFSEEKACFEQYL